MTDKPEDDPPPKKTPVDTRFKKGVSGNPHGRPKGSKNRVTILNAELDAPILVSENGKRKKISKWQASVKQQVNKAASGDQRSFQILVDMMKTLNGGMSVPSPQTAEPLPNAELPSIPLTEEEAARAYAEALGKAETNE